MNRLSAYTPLETLLLFQALRADGTQSVSFNRISEQLKSIPLVRDDPKFDSGRLSPDALRELYLALLKEEARRDLEQDVNSEKSTSNGYTSSNSRKRKAPSPAVPTVQEAEQHSHLIPQLISRLYAGYRNHVVEILQSQEREYASIKREISDIESGQWDHKLQQKLQVVETASPKPSSTAHTQSVLVHQGDTQDSATVSGPGSSESKAEAVSKRYSPAKIDGKINHGAGSQDGDSPHRRVFSNAPVPPVSSIAHQSSRPAASLDVTLPSQAPSTQHAPNHAFLQSPSARQHSQYVPHIAHSRSGPIVGSQLQQPLPNPSPPRQLPPPHGMQFQAPGPVSHSGSSGGPPYPILPHPQQQHMYQGQPVLQSAASPSGETPPRTYAPPSNAHQTPTNYYQPSHHQQQQTYGDRRNSFPHTGQQPSVYHHQPGHIGNMMMPYHLQPQDYPAKVIQRLQPASSLTATQRSPYSLPSQNAPTTGPHNHVQQNSYISGILAALATPPRVTSTQNHLRRLWKPEVGSNTPLYEQTPKPRPEIEPLSPTLQRAKPTVKATSVRRSHDNVSNEDPKRMESVPPPRNRRRGTNARDRSPHSVTSSAVDESMLTRTRSRSISTAAGAHPPSDDHLSKSGVKAEPSTPAELLEEARQTTPSVTAASGVMTRKRRGTIQSQPPPATKRKRMDSPEESASDRQHAVTPTPRSNVVFAVRNFPKMSSVIMNDITSHKHASYFAKEVREKDVPGYCEIVKHAQNLKAIGRAIAIGGRAVTAAASNLDSPLATTGSISTVELERTVDLIPPKAIVNGAQLEKELMRMFANAYMFNPGEDGMALSTKEMFEDVEQKIHEWRSTERNAGGGGAGGVGADEDDDVKGKRRKA